MSTIPPTPVVVVEPQTSLKENFYHFCVLLVASIPVTLAFAAIAWWLGPLIFEDAYTFSFWQTFALIFFLRCIVPRPMSFRYQRGPWVKR
ncbi:hypothetical protein DFO66_103328 [Brevibacterium sanguinis]|uniref:Uncharacterized protein n=2 Tax=Brevibacterium TaxID=1696 RepID=A0A366IKS5_9MICO|nr:MULTISPECIES: hypothetical protein [Brevibacterium]RBP66381.1 hypothetical protein DFO66_103328 [Brevibacterium sanguinis]RBP73033.1 hypothetical protein DFO65_103328 [Brevibacterium celere]